MAKPVIGLQLFTLREHTQNADDFARTMARVAAMGYRAVQVSAVKAPHEAVARITKANGLKIAGTHMGWPRFLEDLDAVVGEHKAWDCRHLAVGGIPADYLTLDGIRRFKDELGPIAERLNAEGMTFSYHNHSKELAHFDGRPWLELLYEQIPADRLKAELDVYWITHGGGDPAAWVSRYPGRQPLLHVKDMQVTPAQEQQFAPVGRGNLNWPAILAAAEAAGVEYALVEQDRVFDGKDVFAEVALSFEFLKRMGLATE